MANPIFHYVSYFCYRSLLCHSRLGSLENKPLKPLKPLNWASGCKNPALRKSLGPRGMYFPILPSSRQCMDTIPHSSWWSTDTIQPDSRQSAAILSSLIHPLGCIRKYTLKSSLVLLLNDLSEYPFTLK